MTVWFASDHHFDHVNIIDFAKRPFASVAEMNREMVTRHNDVVQDKDDVYFLGDFAFSDPRLFLPYMKGRKHLILGNHDQRRLKQLHGCPFQWIRDVALIEVEEQPIFLSHYAHRTWPQSFHGAWHLFGHSHGMVCDHGRSTDVGVDCWGYAPVSFDTLRHRFASPSYDGICVDRDPGPVGVFEVEKLPGEDSNLRPPR